MGQIYMKEETAIHHLKKGRYFFNTPFKRFWNNKKVFVIAVQEGFRPYDYQYSRSQYDWYNKWCWEEDFVSELFDIVWQMSIPTDRQHNLYWLFEFLPESITSSPRYLQLCESFPLFRARATGAAYKTLAARLKPSKTVNGFNKLESLFDSHWDLIKKQGATLVDYISDRLEIPEPMLKDRDYCLNLAEEHGLWAMQGLYPFKDDTDFAVALLEMTDDLMIRGFSYRLRSQVRDGDPMEILKRIKFAEELNASLANNATPVKRQINKV